MTPKDPTPETHPRRGPTPGALVLILLLAAAMLVGFGIQQSLYQRERNANDARLDARDECVETWGRGVIRTLRGRVKANDVLAAAQKRTDNRLYDIVGFIINQRANPSPTITEQDRTFTQVLTRFAVAKADLDTITQQVEDARRANPYRRLDCGEPRLPVLDAYIDRLNGRAHR